MNSHRKKNIWLRSWEKGAYMAIFTKQRNDVTNICCSIFSAILSSHVQCRIMKNKHIFFTEKQVFIIYQCVVFFNFSMFNILSFISTIYMSDFFGGVSVWILLNHVNDKQTTRSGFNNSITCCQNWNEGIILIMEEFEVK